MAVLVFNRSLKCAVFHGHEGTLRALFAVGTSRADGLDDDGNAEAILERRQTLKIALSAMSKVR